MSPRPDEIWITNYPGNQDDLPTDQPDLYNDSAPDLGDGHRALVEHVHALRDKLHAVCLKVGDDSDLPTDCILDKLNTHLAASNPHSVTKSDVGLSNVENVKVELAATRDPNSGDNANVGFSPGSLWVNITDDKAFICTHDEIGNGKWAEVGAGVGGGGQTDTVGGSNGITNTGDNVDAVLTPTYGTAINTICQGNDTRLPTDLEKEALAGTGTPNATNKYVTSDDTNQLPTSGEKDALVGTAGTPGSGNPYVTDSDTRNTNARTPVSHATSHEDGQTDELTVQNLGSGAAVVNKILETDGAGGWNLIDTPSGGGGGPMSEEEFATDGTETPGATVSFALTATPAGSASTPSTYRLLVYRNSVKMGYDATPSDENHYFYDSGSNEVDIIASGEAEEFEVVIFSA